MINEDISAVCSIFGIVGFRLIFKVGSDNEGLLVNGRRFEEQRGELKVELNGITWENRYSIIVRLASAA